MKHLSTGGPAEDRQLLTSEQLGDLLQVSLKFIEKHTAARRLPGMVRVGALWRFRRDEVEAQLATGELLLPKKGA